MPVCFSWNIFVEFSTPLICWTHVSIGAVYRRIRWCHRGSEFAQWLYQTARTRAGLSHAHHPSPLQYGRVQYHALVRSASARSKSARTHTRTMYSTPGVLSWFFCIRLFYVHHGTFLLPHFAFLTAVPFHFFSFFSHLHFWQSFHFFYFQWFSHTQIHIHTQRTFVAALLIRCVFFRPRLRLSTTPQHAL